MYGHQKSELKDCCFVYALQQTGCYDEETLNQIRLRIQNRYLIQNCINELCTGFNIHPDLIFIDEDAPDGVKKKSKVQSQKNKERKNYMGVKTADKRGFKDFFQYIDIFIFHHHGGNSGGEFNLFGSLNDISQKKLQFFQLLQVMQVNLL